MTTISPLIRFYLYIIFLIPSIFCSIITLYYYLIDRTFRKILSNHVLILILILSLFYNLTDIIWLIDFYRRGNILFSSRIFCLIWVYIDFSIFASISYLVTWISIERHLIIFHQNIFSTKFKRILFHYFPMLCLTFYPLIYYFIIIFFISCPISINENKTRCGLTNCGYANGLTSFWDGLINNILPIFSIIIFSILLIIRIWYKKYRLNQRFQWKKYRRMTIQLLSISSIYFLFLFPPMILLCFYSSGLSYSFASEFYSSTLYLSYLITIFLPFVSFFSLPEFRRKFIQIIHLYRRIKQNTIHPQIITVNQIPFTRTNGTRQINSSYNNRKH